MGYASSRLCLAALFGLALIPGLSFGFMTDLAYGQSSSTDSSNLTVKVDKALYESTDVVIITGKSSLNPANQNLEIQVINPNGAIYRTDNVRPSSGGDFGYQVKIGGKYAISGVYTVTVRAADGQGTKTTFEFVPEGMIAAQFTLDGKSYHVRVVADEKPEWLQEISADPQTSSLILHLSNQESQELMMELDHNVIAADPGKCLVVQADGEPLDATCSEVDGDTTLVTMTVPAQTSELQIMGTFLVPEFGIFVVPIVIIAFSVSILAGSKLRR
jgi:hypothetical protein